MALKRQLPGDGFLPQRLFKNEKERAALHVSPLQTDPWLSRATPAYRVTLRQQRWRVALGGKMVRKTDP